MEQSHIEPSSTSRKVRFEDEEREAAGRDAAGSTLPRPYKVGVDGLHARFLLEAFLRDASLEIARVQTLHDALLGELSASAKYLGLDKNAQRSISDQLGALSTLRDFASALSRCATETATKKAEAEKRNRRPSVRGLRPTLVAVQAAARLEAGLGAGGAEEVIVEDCGEGASTSGAPAPGEAGVAVEAAPTITQRRYSEGDDYF